MAQAGKLTVTGTAKTAAEKKFVDATTDTKTIVELVTTDEGKFDDPKTGQKDIPIVPGAYVGSKKIGDKVKATQLINMMGVERVAGLLGETQGETIMHETNEAYIGAKDDPGGNFTTGYKNAHEKAAKLDRVQNKGFDSQKNKVTNTLETRSNAKDTWKVLYRFSNFSN
jgi:hypothetical protein